LTASSNSSPCTGPVSGRDFGIADGIRSIVFPNSVHRPKGKACSGLGGADAEANEGSASTVFIVLFVLRPKILLSHPTFTIADGARVAPAFCSDGINGDSFGFNANYTYADGETDFTWAAGSNNLVGTSKDTYNVGAYFENEKFSARATYSYRSSFLIGLSGANPYYQDDFGTVSLALNYKPTDWLNVSFDALNLNGPTLTYYQSATAPTAFYNNGRQYYLNLRFKF
jgi:hypothetical protein